MRKLRFSTVAICAMAVVLLVIVWVHNSADAWKFRIVDRQTGTPISNVTVIAWCRWTPIRPEKLHLPPGLAWKKRTTVYRKREITIPVYRIAPGSMSLQFSAQGYGDAYFHQFKDPPAYGEVIYAKRRPTQWIL